MLSLALAKLSLIFFLFLAVLVGRRSSKIIEETDEVASEWIIPVHHKHHKKESSNSTKVVRACNSNQDCMKDECCLQRPWSNQFFCARRVREGKVCWSKPHNATDTWDKYRIICPCISKHECRFENPIFILKPVLAASTCQKKKEDDKM